MIDLHMWNVQIFLWIFGHNYFSYENLVSQRDNYHMDSYSGKFEKTN